jgi:hypothetical protein
VTKAKGDEKGDKDSLDLKTERTRPSPEPGRWRSPKRKVKSPGKTARAFLFSRLNLVARVTIRLVPVLVVVLFQEVKEALFLRVCCS